MAEAREATTLATSFQHPGVAAYSHRPPYPVAGFDALESLIVNKPRHVLDIGAGDGAIARPLAERVDRVDALEISAAMVAAGRQRPGGDRENLRWFVDAAETMPLTGPYALVTAGASLHWMKWEPTLDQIDRILAPGAMLAIVDQNYHQLRWHEPVRDVIVRYSRSHNYDPKFSLPGELDHRGLFEIRGRLETAPMEFCQHVDDYIEQFHSTASLARELMAPPESARFDDEIRAAVRDHEDDQGMLGMHTVATIVWGRPIRG